MFTELFARLLLNWSANVLIFIYIARLILFWCLWLQNIYFTLYLIKVSKYNILLFYIYKIRLFGISKVQPCFLPCPTFRNCVLIIPNQKLTTVRTSGNMKIVSGFVFLAAQEHCAMLSLAPWSPNQEESTRILWRLLAPSWHTFTPGPLSWCWSRPPSPSSRWAWQSTRPLLSTPAVLLLLWSPSVSQRQRYVSFPTNPCQLIIEFLELK